jgi:hypothetical protein
VVLQWLYLYLTGWFTRRRRKSKSAQPDLHPDMTHA